MGEEASTRPRRTSKAGTVPLDKRRRPARRQGRQRARPRRFRCCRRSDDQIGLSRRRVVRRNLETASATGFSRVQSHADGGTCLYVQNRFQRSTTRRGKRGLPAALFEYSKRRHAKNAGRSRRVRGIGARRGRRGRPALGNGSAVGVSWICRVALVEASEHLGLPVDESGEFDRLVADQPERLLFGHRSAAHGRFWKRA